MTCSTTCVSTNTQTHRHTLRCAHEASKVNRLSVFMAHYCARHSVNSEVGGQSYMSLYVTAPGWQRDKHALSHILLELGPFVMRNHSQVIRGHPQPLSLSLSLYKEQLQSDVLYCHVEINMRKFQTPKMLLFRWKSGTQKHLQLVPLEELLNGLNELSRNT